ncbi:hypothetical protein TTHERM_00313170 (macronuclear) [Tetrahymena thermophila SB210]|uniref:Uncharacterized protein n=1 Tax=Tetrahymena thermophila (strain SB210) TaxID=312017 RepID=Q22KG4_TETTS|nr:hypothetical protein TTHERM_00313170 [Tetrahymena thermophila SB210]EAR85835.1 hypothetical protein TTHERM_00313170 [Tetrahymena thermophila SB210]|eukprot:XP_001033498.1 hypothetical protein TTHERM_00313170 [Tetrahymena thermophila SB210]
MDYVKGWLKIVPIRFFNNNQNTEEEDNQKLSIYYDLFSKIEETASTKMKDQDKILILKQLEQYDILFAQQDKSE